MKFSEMQKTAKNRVIEKIYSVLPESSVTAIENNKFVTPITIEDEVVWIEVTVTSKTKNYNPEIDSKLYERKRKAAIEYENALTAFRNNK